jgi:hypothetical protein
MLNVILSGVLRSEVEQNEVEGSSVARHTSYRKQSPEILRLRSSSRVGRTALRMTSNLGYGEQIHYLLINCPNANFIRRNFPVVILHVL